ncbi:M23 family metallopeptidase [Sulfurihydrogenibium azorense]|uniref:M23 family metallopeptidase n=1 Tax=Sulfurihydrogenibium azorense TaxID=309806 RepID=UPI0024099584|nr:M23 family metallopeptidase [Sulfurihydrogenibium azorense]MDM7272877.1 M23 family metallopeptidase [Sulfurihydrogenibium azorense]
MRKLFVILFFIVVLGLAYFSGIINFSKPTVEYKGLNSIGSEGIVDIYVKDEKPGLKNVEIFLKQGNNVIKIYSKNLDGKKEEEVKLKINPKSYGLFEGKAVLIVQAVDKSLLKNKTVLEREINIDLTPPVISILNYTQNMINGGTGFVFLQSNEELKSVDVNVGDVNFKCLKINQTYVCPFSIPYYFESVKPIVLNASDYAGNTVNQGLKINVKWINYAKSILDIDDNFIQTKVKPLSDKDFNNPVDLFKYVNVEIRKRNEDLIHKKASECKNLKPMFEGEFTYLENSAKLGGFADYRKYRYNGQIIEGADAYHKGFDFASVKNADVKASNNGEVVFAGFLGIYGNSVIIDHGLCVYTLYSHLSQINVKEGQKVVKGQLIGKTGATGLAVGDHLHYGVLVNGIEVNPVEWFDIKWLNTRFYDVYKTVGGAR